MLLHAAPKLSLGAGICRRVLCPAAEGNKLFSAWLDDVHRQPPRPEPLREECCLVVWWKPYCSWITWVKPPSIRALRQSPPVLWWWNNLNANAPSPQRRDSCPPYSKAESPAPTEHLAMWTLTLPDLRSEPQSSTRDMMNQGDHSASPWAVRKSSALQGIQGIGGRQDTLFSCFSVKKLSPSRRCCRCCRCCRWCRC